MPNSTCFTSPRLAKSSTLRRKTARPATSTNAFFLFPPNRLLVPAAQIIAATLLGIAKAPVKQAKNLKQKVKNYIQN
jgi:hypothetical protein